MLRLVVFALVLCAVFPAAAQIDVEIVDYPSSVQVYSPILITARVRNHSEGPLLIPAGDRVGSGYFVEVGATAGARARYKPISDLVMGGTVRWLERGESWLFQVDIGEFWNHPLGRLYISAGIESNGSCRYRPTGKEGFPLKLTKEKGLERWYECWSGYVVSDVVSVDIVEPESAIDREALDSFKSEHFLGSDPQNGRRGVAYAHLLERFPMSHVTYVEGFYSCQDAPGCLQDLIELQPSNPLAPYMRFQLASSLVKTRRSDELTEESVSRLELPTGLAQYVFQEKKRQNETQGMNVSTKKDPT